MRAKLSSRSHQRYLRKTWRKRNASGYERKRKQRLVAANKAAVEIKRKKRIVQAEKRAVALQQLQEVARNLVLEEADIRRMKACDILLQLRYLRSLKEDNEIPRVKDVKNKQASLPALIEAMKRWHSRHPEARVVITQASAQGVQLDSPGSLEASMGCPTRSNVSELEEPALEDLEDEFTGFDDELVNDEERRPVSESAGESTRLRSRR